MWFTRNNHVDSEHLLGRWDEALRLIDLFSDAPQGVQLPRVLVRSQRALILGARDCGAEAMEEIDGALADMRTTAVDVQLMWPILNRYGRLARRLGRVADANSALSELMDGLAMHESAGDPDVWQSEVVLELSRPAEPTNRARSWTGLPRARGEMSAAQSPNVDSSRRRTSLPPPGSRRCRPSCDSWLPASSSARDVRPRPQCSSIAPGRSGQVSAPRIPARGGELFAAAELAAAAAELDRRPAGRDPRVDAAVHDRVRVEAVRARGCSRRSRRAGPSRRS